MICLYLTDDIHISIQTCTHAIMHFCTNKPHTHPCQHPNVHDEYKHTHVQYHTNVHAPTLIQTLATIEAYMYANYNHTSKYKYPNTYVHLYDYVASIHLNSTYNHSRIDKNHKHFLPPYVSANWAKSGHICHDACPVS